MLFKIKNQNWANIKRRDKMKKSDLKPRMIVRNKISKNIGEIRGGEDGTLYGAPWCVDIRRRLTSGKNKGKFDYLMWNVKNFELVEN